MLLPVQTNVYKQAPSDVEVIKAFSKYLELCEGKLIQEQIISSDKWIDIGIEENLPDGNTAAQMWSRIGLEIRLDGNEIQNPKDYTVGPYPFRLKCSNHTYEGVAMRVEIFVPPLLPGGHVVEWRVTTDKTRIIYAWLHIVEPE